MFSGPFDRPVVRGHLHHYARAFRVSWIQHNRDVNIVKSRVIRNVATTIDALLTFLPRSLYETQQLNETSLAESHQLRAVLYRARFTGQGVVTRIAEIDSRNLLGLVLQSD